MRFLLSAPLIVALATPLAAQPRVVEHTKVRMYLNEEVTIEGPIVRADRGSGGAIWFSLGKPHPSATVVIVVPALYAAHFDTPRDYEGKTVQITGRVSTGESQGIGIDRSGGARTSGASPRTPFIVLEDPSKLKIVPPTKPKEPETGS